MLSQKTFLLIILFSILSAGGGYYIGSMTKPSEFTPLVAETPANIPTADTEESILEEEVVEEEEPVVEAPTPSVSTRSSSPVSTRSATATSSGNVQGARTAASAVTTPSAKTAAPSTPVKRSPSGSF